MTIDGAAGGETKRRHGVTFPLLTLHRGEDRVHFCTGFFQKENMVYTGVLQIFSYEKLMRSRVLVKSYQNKWDMN
jgi:hypothetical protein